MADNVVVRGWLFTLPQATLRQKHFCEVRTEMQSLQRYGSDLKTKRKSALQYGTDENKQNDKRNPSFSSNAFRSKLITESRAKLQQSPPQHKQVESKVRTNQWSVELLVYY